MDNITTLATAAAAVEEMEVVTGPPYDSIEHDSSGDMVDIDDVSVGLKNSSPTKDKTTTVAMTDDSTASDGSSYGVVSSHYTDTEFDFLFKMAMAGTPGEIEKYPRVLSGCGKGGCVKEDDSYFCKNCGYSMH